jgi:pimeloyl-ACP methyl ester carboxylesterase
VPDETGYVTGWPLEIDVMPLIKRALPNMLLSILTRKNVGLTEAMYEGTYNALSLIEKDNDGKYVNNIEVPCYEMPMSELPDEVKEEYYNFLPIQELSEIVGEDNVYYFGYDSLGDVISTTDHLNYYIHNVVLPQTGAKQVKICSISLGGTIAVRYLDKYPEDYKLIKKVVFVEPALDGSNIIGDLLTNNLSVYDDKELYSNILVALLGETPLAYALSIVLRILPSDVHKSALNGLVNGVVDIAALRSPIIWALCPEAYYEEARAIWLENDELTVIREKVDTFQAARANFSANLAALQATGAEVFDLVCYDVNQLVFNNNHLADCLAFQLCSNGFFCLSFQNIVFRIFCSLEFSTQLAVNLNNDFYF